MYEIQLVVKNRFGEFRGNKVLLSLENYEALLKMSKTFYVAGGFELTCEDNSYVIFPPDIVKESILIINKKEIAVKTETKVEVETDNQENKEEDVQE